MTSYISAFKSVFISLLLIFAMEVALASRPSPEPEGSPLYSYKYLRGDVVQKRVVEEKRRLFEHSTPEFVQIGDSSGYYGVQPKIVERYIGNYSYINASCCGDTGYAGYRYLADIYLRDHPSAHYLVLYITPYLFPMYSKEGFSPSIYRAYLSPFRFVDKLPSLQYRIAVTNLVFYGNYSHVMRDDSEFPNYIEKWVKQYPQTGGWVPIPVAPKRLTVPAGECDFNHVYDYKGAPTVRDELEKIKKVTDKYHAHLIVMFNPVACTAGPIIQPIIDDVKDFQKENPDVIVPFPVITTWKPEDFNDPWHLFEKASVPNSERVGNALTKIVR